MLSMYIHTCASILLCVYVSVYIYTPTNSALTLGHFKNLSFSSLIYHFNSTSIEFNPVIFMFENDQLLHNTHMLLHIEFGKRVTKYKVLLENYFLMR